MDRVAALDSELLLTNGILQVGPYSVGLSLFRGVLDIERVCRHLPRLAIQHDVVLCERFLTDTLELILVLLLGGLILQGQKVRLRADPLRAELELELVGAATLAHIRLVLVQVERRLRIGLLELR